MGKKFLSVFVSALFMVCLCVVPISAQTGKYALSEDVLDKMRFYVPESENNPLNMHWVDRYGDEIQTETTQIMTAQRKVRSVQILPTSYDLRKVTNQAGRPLVTSPKHQGDTNYCWAFAATGAAESNVLLQNLEKEAWFTKEEIAFSPLHLGKTAMFEKKGIEGLAGDYLISSHSGTLMGNDFIAASSLSTDTGVQLESEAPFSQLPYGVDDAQQSVSYYHLKDYLWLAPDYNNPTSAENAQKRETVKKWLVENGACTISYGASSVYDGTYKDEKISSSYQCTNTSASHASIIVGWDDEFDCFNPAGTQPPANGAWLIKDSYGEGKGTEGYIWLSYYDTSIRTIGSVCMDTADSYDNHYQYTGVAPFGGFPGVKAANVFTAEKQESLHAISVFTLSENVSYSVTVYRQVEEDNPESGELCATVSGSFSNAGYHTVPIDDTVTLEAGERFSVVLELEGEDSYILLEGYGLSYYTDYTIGVGCSENQSYLNYDFFGEGAEWLDVMNIEDGNGNYVFGNIPIHALTTDIAVQTDKTALTSALGRANTEYGSWTIDKPLGAVEELWNQFQYDVQKAEEVSESNTVKQYEVKNATNNLIAAINLLEKTTKTALAYKDGVVQIDSVKGLGNVVLVAARYNGQKLSGVTPISIGVSKGVNTLDISKDFHPLSDETIKIMLLSGFDRLMPLAEAWD